MKNIKQNRRLNIGFFTGIMEDIYQSRISNNLAAYAEELGVNLYVILGSSLNSPRWFEKEHNIIYNLMNENNLDGLLILSGPMVNFITHEEFKKFLNKFISIPIVTIAQKINNIPTVQIDNTNAVIEEVDHLIKKHNYKNIMYIKGSFSNLEAVERYEAFKKSLKKNNVKLNNNLVYQGDFIYESGEDAVREIIINKKHKVDAVIAASDEMAFGAITVLKQYGYKIPNDIAVVGFDDILMSKYSDPSLTTVAQPFERQTREALDLLIRIINCEKNVNDIIIDSRFIIRKSCGCIDDLKLSNYSEKNIPKIILDSENYRDNNEVINIILKKFDFTKNEKQIISKWINDLLVISEKVLKNESCENDFFTVLYEIPIKQFIYYIDIYIYREIVIELFKYIYSKESDSQNKFKINSLFYESINNIKDTVLHPYLFENIDKTHYSWLLRDVNSNIITRFDFKQLIKSIKDEIVKLNIKTAYISLYDNKPEIISSIEWKIPQYSNLIFAMVDKKELKIKKSKYITKELIPENFLPKNRRYTFVVMALFHHKKQLGIIIFEMDSKNNKLYETLRMIISSAIVSVLTVEEMNKAKLQADFANKAKSDFLTNMSHEIRTPMNSILGFTEILIDEIKNKKHLAYLDKINGSGKELLNIINDILDYAKIESDKIEINYNNFSIRNLLRNTQNLYKPKAENKKIKFNIIIHSNVPKIFIGDDYKLHQIIVNIVDNAFKFTKKGEVIIECMYENNILKIIIEDTGIGIPKDKFETIFCGFYQVDSSTTREYGGTGLGLSISASLIKKMNGNLSFKSKVNKGTTFIIEIPLKYYENKENNSIKNQVKKPDNKKNIKILIAEDNEMNRQFIDALLNKIEINLLYDFAENGKDALDKLDNSKEYYDLLLLDMKMPILNGLDTLKIIKQTKKYNKLYIIALTANSMGGDREKYLNAGCDDYISKPINKDVFLKKIMDFIEKFN